MLKFAKSIFSSISFNDRVNKTFKLDDINKKKKTHLSIGRIILSMTYDKDIKRSTGVVWGLIV